MALPGKSANIPLESGLDTPSLLTHPLNTPSGQGPHDYFTEHKDRRIALFRAPIYSQGNRPNAETQLLDLPNEIISHILELGFFERDADHTPDYRFRSLAAKISRKLHEIVFQTPALWSDIKISYADITSGSWLEALETSLRRSMMHPLALQLSCYWDVSITEDIMNRLLPHITRWESLSVTLTSDHLLTMLENKPAPFLESLTISFYSRENHVSTPPHLFAGYVPRLKHLCLRHVDIYNLGLPLRDLRTLEIRGYGIWPTFDRLNEILGGASLQELVLHVSPSQVLSWVFPNQPLDHQIILPQLRRLTVYTSEWLSPKIAALIRLFACPNLEFMLLNENSVSVEKEPQSIMVYSRSAGAVLPAPPQPSSDSYPRALLGHLPRHLFLHTCNLYTGYQSMSAADLTTLELQSIFWPLLSTLKDVFVGLRNLKNLVVRDIVPKRAVLQILGMEDDEEGIFSSLLEAEQSVPIPSLELLTMQFNRATDIYTSGLFRIFSLPALKSLQLKDLMEASQLKSVVDSFGNNLEQYPNFTALTISNMTAIIDYIDLAKAFPGLQSLTLDGIGSSNTLLRELVPPAAGSVPLRDLRLLAICNAAYLSRPLLHRVILAREMAGRPLRKVLLDKRLSSANPEFLEWIMGHVEVVISDAPQLTYY